MNGLKNRLIDFDNADLAIAGFIVLAICVLFAIGLEGAPLLVQIITAVAALAQIGSRKNGNGSHG